VQELQFAARRVIGRLMYSGYRICSIFRYDPLRAVEPGGRAGSMDRKADSSQLSPRELQVASAYANGASYREIADALFIAPATVRTHLGSIYRKLGVSSKLELHRVLEGQAGDVGRESDDGAALVAELALSLEEAYRRERELAAVLSIISHSRGCLEEVIASVLDHALEVCDAEFGILFDYAPGGRFRAAHMRSIPQPFEDWLIDRGTFRVGPDTGLGRMESSLKPVNIVDVRAEGVYRRGDPLRVATADLGGARSFAAIPMLAGERLLGAFTVYRQQLRPFDDRNLELAQMFADQAAIAIENARLINALASDKG